MQNVFQFDDEKQEALVSIAAIIGAISSIATIVGGFTYFFKYSSWALTRTQAQKDADIDKANQDAKHEAEDTGRPA